MAYVCNHTVIKNLVGIPNQRRELEQNKGNKSHKICKI